MENEKYIIKKIQKLLNLANGRNASEGEVKTAMQMAQRLMTKYKISIANIGDEKAKNCEIRHEEFFSRKGGLNPADTCIINILLRFYRVRVLITHDFGKRGMMLVGTPEDIEIAKYVHSYLRKTFFDCWNNYKKENFRAERSSYYRGLSYGIIEKLDEAESQAKAEETETACQNYEIVLVNTKEAINNYINEIFGSRVKNERSRRVSSDSTSYHAGFTKGKTITINQAIKA